MGSEKLAVTGKTPASGKVNSQVATPAVVVAVQVWVPEVMVTASPSGTGVLAGTSLKVALMVTDCGPAKEEMFEGRVRLVDWSTTVTMLSDCAGSSPAVPAKLAVTVRSPRAVRLNEQEADPVESVVVVQVWVPDAEAAEKVTVSGPGRPSPSVWLRIVV